MPDGSAPGWFNLRAYQPEKQVKYDKESLVLHEAVPGHIFQGTLARSMKDLPDFRKFYGNSAYNEGWALYVESLGSQLGVFKDPYSRFGQLASERFRAAMGSEGCLHGGEGSNGGRGRASGLSLGPNRAAWTPQLSTTGPLPGTGMGFSGNTAPRPDWREA